MIGNYICIARYKNTIDELKDNGKVPRGGGYNFYILQDKCGKRIVAKAELIKPNIEHIQNLSISESGGIVIKKPNNYKYQLNKGGVYIDKQFIDSIEEAIYNNYTGTDRRHVSIYANISGSPKKLSFKSSPNIYNYMSKAKLIGMNAVLLNRPLYAPALIVFWHDRIEILTEDEFIAEPKCSGLLSQSIFATNVREIDFSAVNFKYVQEIDGFLTRDALTYRVNFDYKIILPDSIKEAKITDLHYIFQENCYIEGLDKINTNNVKNIAALAKSPMYGSTFTDKFGQLREFLIKHRLNNVTNTDSAFSSVIIDRLDLTICGMDMSKIETANRMFYYSNIGTIKMEGALESVQDAACMFSCAKIGNIINTSGENTKLSFSDCVSMCNIFADSTFDKLVLGDIKLHSDKSYGTTNINSVFEKLKCKDFEIGTIDIYGTTTAYELFKGAEIDNADISKIVINIHKASRATLSQIFSGCNAPKFDVEINFIDQKPFTDSNDKYVFYIHSSAIAFENAFECARLRNITITSNNDTKIFEDMTMAFYKSVVNNIKFDNVNITGVTNMYGAFSCINARKVHLAGNTAALENVDKIFNFAKIDELIIGDWHDNKVSSRARKFGLFSGNSDIKHKQGVWIDGRELSKT